MGYPVEDLHVDEGPDIAAELSSTAAVRVGRTGTRPLVLLAPWLRPAGWAPVVARMPLKLCFAVHLLGALAAFVACMVMIDLESSASGSHWSPWVELVRFWAEHPDIAAVVTGITVGSIELSFLATAFILTPWGAGDERLRSSYTHALRHTWFLSTQAVPIILAFGLAFVLISAADREFRDRHPYPNIEYPTPPTYPAGATPNSQAMKDYQAAQAEYQLQINSYQKRWQKAWRETESLKPLHLRIAPALTGWLCIAAGVWVLWTLLRAIGAPRGLTPILRPPTCEFCGYNLTGTVIESRCPECGTPAIDSLGPDARPGTPIDLATKHRWLSAWWKSGIEAMRRPGRFGQLIQVNQPSRRYRWCLAAPLLVGIPAAGMTFLATLWIQFMRFADEDLYSVWSVEMFTIAAPAMGISSAVGLVGVVLSVAAVVGWIMSWQNGRNLLPAAMQMQAHLGLFVVLWILFGCAWTMATFFMEYIGVFRDMQRALFIDHDFLMFFFWFVPVAAWLCLDGVLLWKGVSAARYANK